LYLLDLCLESAVFGMLLLVHCSIRPSGWKAKLGIPASSFFIPVRESSSSSFEGFELEAILTQVLTYSTSGCMTQEDSTRHTASLVHINGKCQCQLMTSWNRGITESWNHEIAERRIIDPNPKTRIN